MDHDRQHAVVSRGALDMKTESNGHEQGPGRAGSHGRHASISGISTISNNGSAAASSAGGGTERTPKRRRKVNHACVYCRRSHMTCDHERPCARCIKRNIGHLCHDEPRESETRKSKSGTDAAAAAAAADDADDGHDNHHTQAPPPPPPPAAPNQNHQQQQQHQQHQQQHQHQQNQHHNHQQHGAAMHPPSFDAGHDAAAPKPVYAAAAAAAGMLNQANPMQQLVRPSTVSALQPNLLASNDHFGGYSDAWLTANQFHDMHNPSSYMIVPEVSGELQFLNDFLQSSMVDDAAYVSDDQNASSQLLRSAPPGVATSFLTSGSGSGTAADGSKAGAGAGAGGSNALLQQPSAGALGAAAGPASGSMLPPPDRGLDVGVSGRPADPATPAPAPMTATGAATPAGTAAGRTAAADKAREYYLQAADPSGNDTPEQRMSDLLKAKYEAGLLRPFNYVNGYARLHKYLDSHKIAPASKQKIQRQLDRFRPKFREKMQALTDLELIYVEMWFEKTLMEYDRVFASMAVPACCWRRTGEIFRGNKEMAELIHVPVERLRDGQIALHEILTEESLVRYWEEFGTIAFDAAHDTLLTACSIKNPDAPAAKQSIVKCCFSLKIRRDDHKIPSLIVGNFLPHDPLTQ